MIEAASCICCGGAGRPHYPGLCRCPACGHVWADLRLSDDEIRELYSAAYYQGHEYIDYASEAASLERNFRPRLAEICRLAAPGGRLLELGCAYGFFLKLARADYRVEGCEISEHAAAQARDRLALDVWTGDYAERPAPREPYDVACLWDTIEHLRHPDLYLKKLHAELRPGGLLALSTGDIGAWTARLRGRKWRLLHPPTHLHYFTTGSMRRMLQGIGFEVVRIRHDPFWRNVDGVAGHLLAGNPGRPAARFYEFLHRLGILNFNFPINTFDLMTVYARKITGP